MMEVVQPRPRSIVIDSEWQYGDGFRQNKLKGFVTVHQPGELKAVLRDHLGAPFKILYQPRFEPRKHFDAICTLAIEAQDLTLDIDEAANYCDANWMPDPFDYLCRCGRHCGVSMDWTTQRPPDVARGLTSPSKLYFFRLQESRDLKFCRERGVPDHMVDEISRLPRREFVTKNPDGVWVRVA